MLALKFPIDKVFVTQRFGVNPATYRQFNMRGHNGLDFRTRFIDSPLGHRYVTAMAAGKVIEIGRSLTQGYGNFIRIAHENGQSQTLYAHLQKFYVGLGYTVVAGQRIALSDNTGFSSAPHLHIGYRPIGWQKIYNNGFLGYVDPTPFLPPLRQDV